MMIQLNFIKKMTMIGKLVRIYIETRCFMKMRSSQKIFVDEQVAQISENLCSSEN